MPGNFGNKPPGSMGVGLVKAKEFKVENPQESFEEEISETKIKVLQAIKVSQGGRFTIPDIAKKLGLELGSVRYVVNILREAGLVEAWTKEYKPDPPRRYQTHKFRVISSLDNFVFPPRKQRGAKSSKSNQLKSE